MSEPADSVDLLTQCSKSPNGGDALDYGSAVSVYVHGILFVSTVESQRINETYGTYFLFDGERRKSPLLPIRLRLEQ